MDTRKIAFKMNFFLFVFLLLLIQCECKFVGNHKVSKERDEGKGSLVFVFDTTGSMFDDLRQLKVGAEMILSAALEDSSSIADFVFVPFHDPAVGPVTVTKNKELFKNALNIVRVYGGGDCPERSLSGIILGLENSRPNSQVYVFTDASATDHYRLSNVLDLLQRMQSQVVFVLTGHCNDLKKPSYQVYPKIAAASAGQVFNLNKTSVHNVLDFVRSSLKGRKVNLGTVINMPGYNQTRKIPIDNTLEEVTVSVSGIKPQIKVTAPKGQELSGPPKLVTVLDLNEIMIVKVLQPEPGNWTVTVGSEKDHSVKVIGLSNLTFHHGFSVGKPNSFAETSYRPLQGTYNHMLISLSGPTKYIKLKCVEILNLDGKTLFEMPLHEVNNSNIYSADAFLPPDDLFYIAINGRDEYGQELKRVGSTAVQAKQPDVPYLKTPKKIEARSHDTVILECQIDSLVPITAMWTLDNRWIQEQKTSLQSTAIEYTINDMSEQHAGTYKCFAKNLAGTATSYTEVVMLVDPPQIQVLPDNVTLQPGSEVNISCTVFTEALLTKLQLMFTGPKNYALDIDITPNLDGVYVFNKTLKGITKANQGLYTCIASNRGGESNQSTYITVLSKPTARIIGPHTLAISIHTPIQIVCQTENAKLVQWTDERGNVIKVEKVNGSHISMFDIVNVTNDGLWTCTGLNDFYNASDSIQIKVLVKPQVSIEGPKNITLLNGTSYEVTCNVVAIPKPRIIWHKETEMFLNNIITVPSPHHYTSVLIINSTDDKINRTYFCFGENSEGIAHDSISVYIGRKMEILQGFNDTVVNFYSKLMLHCKIDSFPPAKISWYHNNTKIHQDENKQILQNDTLLHVTKVDFGNLGDYSCEGNNGYEKVYVNGTISFNDLEKPEILKDPVRTITQKGKSTIITCRIIKGVPKPSVSWLFKNNTSEYSSLPRDVLQTKSQSELIILSVKISHEGIYRCFAENIVGKDVFDSILVVQYPPEFISTQPLENNRKDIKAGTKIKLSCEAIGSPLPEVVWNKDGLSVAYSDNVYLNDKDLVIQKSSISESGVYTCIAVSNLGSQKKDFFVNVYEPPTIVGPGIESVLDVLEGQLVEMPCRAIGVPAPKVVWLQNGGNLTRRKYVDDFGIRFVANLTDFGEYTCFAQNGFGNASLTYLLQVWVPPSIMGPLRESTNSLKASNISLNCDAVGFPVPRVLWEYQGHLLVENTSSISFNKIGNIYIQNLNTNHEGLYACVAENAVGVARKFTYLNVHELPEIHSDNYLEPYLATNLDTVLSLPCKVAGTPKPYVVWNKDGIYLDRDGRFDTDTDGTLTIKYPSEELSGEYICVAKNIHGVVNKTVQVNIYSVIAHIQSDESQTTMHTVEGKNISITCPAKYSQNETVKWYKDAMLVTTGDLVFFNVSRLNASTYACVVSSIAFTTYHTLDLVVEWQPKFVKNGSKNIETLNGEDVLLDCEVDARPKARTKWFFKSRILFGEENSRLTVKNVKKNIAGLYKCIVSNVHGTSVREFILDVVEPPFISDFDVLDVELMLGSNASLECNSKGFPTPIITWIFNNTHWQVQNTFLKSTNITFSSEGIYRCEARNKVGRSHLVYRVKVVLAPEIKEIVLFNGGEGYTVQRKAEVIIGTKIRLSCYTTGNPLPKIQWIKNGIVLADNEGLFLQSNDETNEHIPYIDLTIEQVQSGSAGEFICIASNDIGIDQKSIQIVVLEPPKIFQNLFQIGRTSSNITNIEVLSGQAFFLHCHPYGFPIPVVYWFKDGVPLKLFDRSMVSKDFGETLLSDKALVEQSGNYTCVARNKAGNTSVVYLVDVLDNKYNTNFGYWLDSCIMTNKVGTTEVVYNVLIEQPPYIFSENEGNMETHVLPLKRSLVLKCDVKGHPEPKITWLKNTQPLSQSSASIHQVLSGRILTFWSVNIEDGSQYICLAENSAGTAHRRYNVIVKVPGKWTPFSSWSFCNATCGLGYQRRERNCHFIDDFNNVIDKTSKSNYLTIDETTCKGSSTDRRKCHMPPCEEDTTSHWTSWSSWSDCSASCDVGTQSRTRRCRSKASCQGDNVQIRKCPGLPKCVSIEITENGEPANVDEDTENEPFIPEATFELQPGVIDYTPLEVEQFNTLPDSKPASLFYEVHVTENLDKSYRGHCDFGFSLNNKTQNCDDIDECLINNNHCHMTQICINVDGGYKCGCPESYVSLGAGQRCLDINECELDAHMCEFACVNTAGGYVCACPSHLRLHIDRHHCVKLLERERIGLVTITSINITGVRDMLTQTETRYSEHDSKSLSIHQCQKVYFHLKQVMENTCLRPLSYLRVTRIPEIKKIE